MKKTVLRILIALSVLIGFMPTFNASAQDELNVAIVQLVSHASLDEINEGIVEGLAENGYVEGENLTIDFQNAENDMNLLNTIAEQVVAQEPDLIFAITTPVAQSFQNATEDIPIVMAGVTDPEGSNIVESNEEPGGNISGISDAMPHDVQFELAQHILPEAQTVGLIYSTSEDNSLAEVEDAQAAAEAIGYEVIVEGINSPLDMQMVAENLASQVDFVFVGSDNTIASAFDALLNATDNAGIPVFSTIELMIQQGALAGVGIDQKQIGLDAADFSMQVIEGEDISTLPVQLVEDLTTMINSDTAERLEIEIPEEIISEATDLSEE